MSQKDRIVIFPTRNNLMMMQLNFKNAERGYSLCERKNEALKIRFRAVSSKLLETKLKFSENWNNWQFSLTEAKFACGAEFTNSIVLENVDTAMIKVFSKKDNVAGVLLPGFELYKVHDDPNKLIGLARGGQVIQKVKKNFQNAIQILVEIATMQTQFFALDDTIKQMSRRVNAIKNVIIPRFVHTIRYILNELDEIEREEFYRMKLIKSKKIQMQMKKDYLKESEIITYDIAAVPNIFEAYRSPHADLLFEPTRKGELPDFEYSDHKKKEAKMKQISEPKLVLSDPKFQNLEADFIFNTPKQSENTLEGKPESESNPEMIISDLDSKFPLASTSQNFLAQYQNSDSKLPATKLHFQNLESNFTMSTPKSSEVLFSDTNSLVPNFQNLEADFVLETPRTSQEEDQKSESKVRFNTSTSEM